MSVVAVMTSVSQVDGSYGVAGMAAALVGIGTMISGPIYGMLADRYGQRPVLIFTAIGNAAMLAGLAWQLNRPPVMDLPDENNAPMIYLAAFLIGATQPQATSMVRTRWLQALRSEYPDGPAPKLTNAVLSYESMTDELVFVLGPVFVGAAAVLLGVVVPLNLAAILTLTGVLGFAFHPSARYSRGRSEAGRRRIKTDVPEAPATPSQSGAFAAEQAGGTSAAESPGESQAGGGAAGTERTPAGGSTVATKTQAPAQVAPASALVAPRVLVPVLGMMSIGLFFGSMLTSLTGFMEVRGSAESTGLFYGIMGVTSAASALSMAALPERFTPAARWLSAALIAAGGATILILGNDMPWLIAALLIQGGGIGPALVTLYSIAAEVSPAGRMTAIMSMMATGVTVGQSGASALAGRLVDGSGYYSAFFMVLGATLALLVLAVVHTLMNRAAVRR